MVGVGKHEEDILENWDKKLLEESCSGRSIGFVHIVDQLDAHVQAGSLDFSIVMFGSPETSVNDVLELTSIEFEKG